VNDSNLKSAPPPSGDGVSASRRSDPMTGAPAALETIDLQHIMKLLPHRYPFLMVDRIIDINGSDSATGLKNVTANEPHFQGHFPGHPIMPGVLILEGMAQTAGAISILAFGSDAPKLVYLMTIDEARFRKPVVPGDVLEYHVRKARGRGFVWKFACEAKVGGATVAEAMITAMMNDPDK
jgi:3-hydroxyacyl-[acyl-carrier-protein] dehydratase